MAIVDIVILQLAVVLLFGLVMFAFVAAVYYSEDEQK